MKAYYYLIFRIYIFYKETLKETDGFILSASILTSVLITFNLLSIVFAVNNLKIIYIGLNKYVGAGLTILVWGINYFLLLKDEPFLEMGFTKNRTGGAFVSLYVALSFFAFFYLASLGKP